ncbi:hypothetical protein [Paenibacillus sp. sgz500958]|uniref:hypothetical protein n=1 Tax=Paenibacillus sp. sgz500958 TaxID=3242475 RepID=UPI0036D2D883
MESADAGASAIPITIYRKMDIPTPGTPKKDTRISPVRLAGDIKASMDLIPVSG